MVEQGLRQALCKTGDCDDGFKSLEMAKAMES